MSRIDSVEVRPSSNQDDPPPLPGRGARGFNYAALLARRRTIVRPVSDAPTAARSRDDRDAQPDTAVPPSGSFSSLPTEYETADAESHLTPAELLECRAVGSRIASAAAPIASVTLQAQRDHLGLLDVLSREIAAFCTDGAVASGGQWEAHLVLSDRILAATELQLSLSHFDLQLRFDARDLEARQLLLAHSTALEHALDTMLRAWGQPKRVRITVW
ncbi:type III secretion protein HpaP [Burkholderia lata]|uniref:Type III secretion protein HpaP n=1 Tax=Burkholderia lata (strain ATCC 17760 / DSM 23089 / LMG 22485 / NCIMB 9086 / R18194 / 383) TaxID=482957 RepID=A0A6P2S252_BURL3|nr:type III secretion system protein SctP [Burkholderia lata]VWC38117.1 type III secretion protein HpaP [Burkholderia lata]